MEQPACAGLGLDKETIAVATLRPRGRQSSRRRRLPPLGRRRPSCLTRIPPPRSSPARLPRSWKPTRALRRRHGDLRRVPSRILRHELPGSSRQGGCLEAEPLAAADDISRLRDPGHPANAGLAPVSRDSGKTPGRLVRALAGNHSLKCVFLQAAFASRHDQGGRTYYNRKHADGKRRTARTRALTHSRGARSTCSGQYSVTAPPTSLRRPKPRDSPLAELTGMPRALEHCVRAPGLDLDRQPAHQADSCGSRLGVPAHAGRARGAESVWGNRRMGSWRTRGLRNAHCMPPISSSRRDRATTRPSSRWAAIAGTQHWLLDTTAVPACHLTLPPRLIHGVP